jgi:hypothetical protein
MGSLPNWRNRKVGARRRYARRLAAALTLAAAACVLLVPTAVMSAVAYRIWTEPPEPVLGQPATILVATYLPDSGVPAGSLEPLVLPEFPWDFVADSPTSERHSVALTRDGIPDNQWSGRFTFDELGEWEIGLDPRHLGRPLDPSLGARSTVNVVREGSPNTSMKPPSTGALGRGATFITALAAGASLLGVFLAVLTWRSRRQ